MSAWEGDEDYRKALDPPCGCEVIAESERQSDIGVAAIMRDAGEAAQRRWRCPHAGYSFTDDPPTDPGVVEALACVKRVTGADGFCTCPSAYTHTPMVGRVVRAYRSRKLGILRAIEPEMSAALADGILILDDAINARQAHDSKRSQKRHEQNTPQSAATAPTMNWKPG